MIRHAPSIGIGIGLSLRGSGARFSGILDQYAGAAAAYSLRALSSAWLAGDVVEVRRSSDSTTQSFTANEVSNGTLEAFCGVGDGFVSTWYDQSGNGNDATQATTTAQPKIVDAGALVTGGLDFDGVDDQLDLSGSGLDIFKNVGYGHLFTVITADTTTTGSNRYFEASVGGDTFARVLLGDSQDYASSSRIGGRRLDADSFQDIESSTSHGNNETLITAFLSWADSDAYLYFNGTEVAFSTSFQTDGNTSDTSSVSASIGGTSSFNGDFKAKEFIIYNTDQSANRAGIETNINDHYSIY